MASLEIGFHNCKFSREGLGQCDAVVPLSHSCSRFFSLSCFWVILIWLELKEMGIMDGDGYAFSIGRLFLILSVLLVIEEVTCLGLLATADLGFSAMDILARTSSGALS